jgi:hypothetical protein
MQPSYLPWAGYFRLIGLSKVFVFLDDAQYERGTWHQRNRVLSCGTGKWITIPVRRVSLGQSILEVEVEDRQGWRKQHMEMVRHSYARHPFRKEVLEGLDPVLDMSITSLADLNIALIERFADGLGLSRTCRRSSTMNVPDMRTDRVIALCDAVGADEYLSPKGAEEYLRNDGFTDKTTVRLSFDDFIPAPYPQLGAEDFISHLSMVDVVANLGWDGARHYLNLEERNQ